MALMWDAECGGLQSQPHDTTTSLGLGFSHTPIFRKKNHFRLGLGMCNSVRVIVPVLKSKSPDVAVSSLFLQKLPIAWTIGVHIHHFISHTIAYERSRGGFQFFFLDIFYHSIGIGGRPSSFYCYWVAADSIGVKGKGGNGLANWGPHHLFIPHTTE